MNIHLPKKLSFLTTEPVFPVSDPIARISPVKNGVLLYNMAGELIGQAFLSKKSVRATLADSGSIDISRNGKEVNIKGSCLLDAERTVKSSFVFFGNAETYQFMIYEKKPLEKKPALAACAVSHLISEGVFCLKIEPTTNPLWMALISLSIALLNEKA